MAVSLGVNAAIFDDHGRILLTLREDFEIWCMPGGGVDAGEDPYNAVIREAQEETGLIVRPTRLVGMYTRPSWMHLTPHIMVFATQVIGGKLERQVSEVLDMRYFALDELPDNMLLGQAFRIEDAAKGVTGTLVTEDIAFPLPQVQNRRDLYAARDASGLARQAFYMQTFAPLRREQFIRHL